MLSGESSVYDDQVWPFSPVPSLLPYSSVCSWTTVGLLLATFCVVLSGESSVYDDQVWPFSPVPPCRRTVRFVAGLLLATLFVVLSEDSSLHDD